MEKEDYIIKFLYQGEYTLIAEAISRRLVESRKNEEDRIIFLINEQG